jgi:hypothetical protein
MDGGAKETRTSTYRISQNGRDAYPILATAFTAALALTFLFISHWSMKALGAGLVFFALSGAYAFLKGEKWTLGIENGVFSWSYDRWPKSTGRIDLKTVSCVVVDDCSGAVLFTFKDGQTRKVKLLGRGEPLKDYLRQHFPTVAVEFVEGT